MTSDLPEIKQGLKDRIVDLCAKLLPGGRQEGGQWVSCNPNVAGDHKKLPALKVGLRRDKGAWRCWRNGDHGDVLKLVEFCTGTDLKGALQWSRDFLGLRQMSRQERDAMRFAAEARAKRDTEAAEKARAFKLTRAQELFEDAPPLGRGSMAEALARAYFAARACPLEDVEHLNTLSFGFAAGTEWWKGAKWKNEEGRRIKVSPGPKFPAIHSAMRQATGIVTCCHVTFLDPLLPKKAPVTPPKLMFGEALGAVIEVSTGPSKRPFWFNGVAPGPVIIAEGIETALSLALAIPEARVWAGGSLAGMGGAPVHLPCVSGVTVARDNNAGNAQAQAQLNACLDKLDAHGKPLVVMRSHVGDDFNDLIRGEDP